MYFVLTKIKTYMGESCCKILAYQLTTILFASRPTLYEYVHKLYVHTAPDKHKGLITCFHNTQKSKKMLPLSFNGRFPIIFGEKSGMFSQREKKCCLVRQMVNKDVALSCEQEHIDVCTFMIASHICNDGKTTYENLKSFPYQFILHSTIFMCT